MYNDLIIGITMFINLKLIFEYIYIYVRTLFFFMIFIFNKVVFFKWCIDSDNYKCPNPY